MGTGTPRTLAATFAAFLPVLGSACNLLLGNVDATATDAGSYAEGGGVADGGSAPDAASSPDAGGDAGSPDDATAAPDSHPEYLWVEVDDPRAVAVDANNLYWIDANDVYECPLAGCGSAPTQLASGGTSFAAILADGHYLYWTDEGKSEVGYCSVSPGPCVPKYVPSATMPHGLAHDQYTLYWSLVASGSIRQCGLDGLCVAGPTASARPAPRALAVAGMGDLYWTEGVDAGAVTMCPYPYAIGCTPMTLVTTSTVPGEIVGDATSVYFTLPAENRVVSIDSTSKIGMDVATNQNHPTYLAVAAKYAYWVDLDGLKYCRRGVACATPTLLAPLQLQPGGIAVTATFVYGALRALDHNGNMALGAVYRVAAPP